LTEVADAIRRRRVSSVEVTQACIDQARRVQPKPAAPQEQPQPEQKQPPGSETLGDRPLRLEDV
jgi:Asp-tRNA(Asn)/Glu-tRNA(Gln) amidotransferase A subunit family amidase